MDKQNSSKPSQNQISKDDIDNLLFDPSTKARMNVVEKLVKQYVAKGEEGLNKEQTEIANEIFGILLTQGEVIVRSMLAMNLSQTDKLPSALAKQIAGDINSEVATPVLQYSNVLNDKDLLEVINSMVDSDKLQAIAKRDIVSEKISNALVKTNIEPVISTLIKNEGAEIADKTLEKIAETHGNSPEVMESMFQRNSVPVAVIEKIIGHLSIAMRQHLESKYKDLAEVSIIRKVLDTSLESARLKMMGIKAPDRELKELLKQLGKDNKLSPFLAISMCDLELFEVSFSRLLRIPLKNLHILIQDAGGFMAAYKRAALPEDLFKATELALLTMRDIERNNLKQGVVKKAYSTAGLIERMNQLSAAHKIEGLDRLYSIMQSLSA